jgi:hypothetical protein
MTRAHTLAASPVALRLCLLSSLAACGGAQPQGETIPGRRELIIDEPTVVRARPPRAPDEPPGTEDLPELPEPLPSLPEAFRRAHALSPALLTAEGPGVPPSEDAAHARWSEDRFAPWLAARSAALQAVVDAFAPARSGTGAERVVAAALVGMGYARLHAQLVAVPPPASVAADEKLARVYRSALDAQASAFLEQCSAALAHCAGQAAAQTEAPYGLWLQLCQQERLRLVQHAEQARTLAELVEAERKADRVMAEGPRPPGPEVCWTAEPASEPGEPAADASAESAAAAAPSSARKACARHPALGTAPTPAPRTARDQRYGIRDPETSVRVSAALTEVETMDASPLTEPATRHALATCFAQHVRGQEAVTVALHASLVVDARGKARAATLTPEPSDEAAAPSPALSRCMQRALLRVAFDCSPGDAETQARVTYCMRRD